jgi:serine/threonine protein kinase
MRFLIVAARTLTAESVKKLRKLGSGDHANVYEWGVCFRGTPLAVKVENSPIEYPLQEFLCHRRASQLGFAPFTFLLRSDDCRTCFTVMEMVPNCVDPRPKGKYPKSWWRDHPRYSRRVSDLMDAGIMHNDLTYGNIYVRDGELFLIDFGCAIDTKYYDVSSWSVAELREMTRTQLNRVDFEGSVEDRFTSIFNRLPSMPTAKHLSDLNVRLSREDCWHVDM